MKRSLVLLSLFALLIFTSVAVAQEEEEEVFERDVLEINFFGGVDGPTGDLLDWKDTLGAKTGYNFGLDLGYFITEKIVSGVGFRFSQYSIAGQEHDLAVVDLAHRAYNPAVYLKYYLFPVSNFSPYVKVDGGLSFLKFTTWVTNPNGDRYRQLSYDPAFSFSIGAGGFLYTADYGGFFVEANYHRVLSSDVEADYEGGTYLFGDDISTWDIHGGLRVLIGSGE